MRVIVIIWLIGFIALAAAPPIVPINPQAHIRSGAISLTAFQFQAKSIDSLYDGIVTIHFSAESAAIEFFVIHSDYYNLAGLPDITLCQFHTIARSGSCQFRVESSETWYLVFANSPQNQQVTYEWIEYTIQEWNTRLAINWAIIIGCILIASAVLIKYARKRIHA